MYLTWREQVLLPAKGSIMLNATIHYLGQTAVVGCVGRIVAGGEADTLRKAVLSQRKRRAVVLDLSGVDTIDGGGIGLLVFLHGWAHAAGINLHLMNPARLVREVLELTNLDSVFKISSSEDRSHRIAAPAGDTTTAY